MSSDGPIEFSSPEDAFTWMGERELDAIQHALPEQWSIERGSRVVRIVDELWIFGELFTENQFLEIDGPINEAELDEETSYELAMLRDAHDRGWRYGKWFSIVVPEGEYGSAHVASLWPITVTDFEEARKLGWQVPGNLAFRVGTEVGEAVKKKRESDG